MKGFSYLGKKCERKNEAKVQQFFMFFRNVFLSMVRILPYQKWFLFVCVASQVGGVRAEGSGAC